MGVGKKQKRKGVGMKGVKKYRRGNGVKTISPGEIILRNAGISDANTFATSGRYYNRNGVLSANRYAAQYAPGTKRLGLRGFAPANAGVFDVLRQDSTIQALEQQQQNRQTIVNPPARGRGGGGGGGGKGGGGFGGGGGGGGDSPLIDFLHDGGGGGASPFNPFIDFYDDEGEDKKKFKDEDGGASPLIDSPPEVKDEDGGKGGKLDSDFDKWLSFFDPGKTIFESEGHVWMGDKYSKPSSSSSSMIPPSLSSAHNNYDDQRVNNILPKEEEKERDDDDGDSGFVDPDSALDDISIIKSPSVSPPKPVKKEPEPNGIKIPTDDIDDVDYEKTMTPTELYNRTQYLLKGVEQEMKDHRRLVELMREKIRNDYYYQAEGCRREYDTIMSDYDNQTRSLTDQLRVARDQTIIAKIKRDLRDIRVGEKMIRQKYDQELDKASEELRDAMEDVRQYEVKAYNYIERKRTFYKHHRENGYRLFDESDKPTPPPY